MGCCLLLLGEQRVRLGLTVTALAVKSEYLLNESGSIEILDFQFVDDELRVVTKKLKGKQIIVFNEKRPYLESKAGPLSDIENPGPLVLEGDYGHIGFVGTLAGELDSAIHESV